MNRLRNLDELDGNSPAESSEYFGIQGPYGDNGPSILVIDDRSDVIENFLRSLESDDTFEVQFYFFRITNKNGAHACDLLQWVKDNRPLAGIFIDGELESKLDGSEIAEKIRDIAGMRYQPIAILTANLSWVQTAKDLPDNLPVMLKFEQKASDTLRRLCVELHGIQISIRDKMWRDLQFELAIQLENGINAKSAAEFAGQFFVEHDSAKAWYLRDLREDGMHAIAMKDAYDAGEFMSHDKTSTFLIELVQGETDRPWIVKNDLSSDDTFPRKGMKGDHCMAAALGAGEATHKGSFTVYRNRENPKFEDQDARELHHVALQIRSALAKETQMQRQERVARTIEAVMMATNSGEAAEELKEFVHEEVNSPSSAKGKSKTTVRLFLRGTGDLQRWLSRSASRDSLGALGKGGNSSKININNKESVIARVIRESRTKLVNDRDASSEDFLASTEGVQSYLTVPMMHRGAVLGVVNLEANYKNAYTVQDQKLVEAMASATAANVFRQRADRFMADLADLAALAVRPSADDRTTAKDILSQAATAVYLLCGYSNLVLIEPPNGNENDDHPWIIVAGWSGDGIFPKEDDAGRLQLWKEKLERDWAASYVKKTLSSTSYESDLFFTNDKKDTSRDDGKMNIRPVGHPTLSQLVIRIGPGKNPISLMSLLFEHPWPVPESYLPMLKAFADFMSAVYDADRYKLSRFGESLAIQRHEARIGRYYAQVRHNIIGKLAKMKARIKLELRKGTAPEAVLDDVQKRLVDAERAVKATRAFVKVPDIGPCNPCILWNQLISEEDVRANQFNIELIPSNQTSRVLADEDILKTVMFNLLDNALIHGEGIRSIKMKLENGRICIRDNGKRIRDDSVNRLFEPGFTTAADGTGQGLYLSREQVRDMGGSLSYIYRDNENHFIISLEEMS